MRKSGYVTSVLSSYVWQLFTCICLSVACSDLPPNLRTSNLNSVAVIPDKIIEVSSADLTGDIGFLFSVKLDGTVKSSELYPKFQGAFSSITESLPSNITATSVIVSDNKCGEGMTTGCLNYSESSSLKVSKFYANDSPENNVLSYLDVSEIASHLPADSNVGIVALTNTVNSADTFASDHFNSLKDNYVGSKFFGFDTTGFDSMYCDDLPGGTNFKELADLMDGRNYSVCQESWSEDFKKITEMMLVDTKLKMTLPDDVSRILTIAIGDEFLEEHGFDEETKEFSIKYSDLFSGLTNTELSIIITYE
jgi:hypothetical protein